MEREHLIIIALILVAIYVMNKDDSKDTVKNIAPMGRIRYEGEPEVLPFGHIRSRRESFDLPDGEFPAHIRYSDKYIGQSQHIKNSIRYDNRDRMFNGMFAGAPQRIRYDECGPNSMPPC